MKAITGEEVRRYSQSEGSRTRYGVSPQIRYRQY